MDNHTLDTSTKAEPVTLGQKSRNGQARAQALHDMHQQETSTTTVIEYQSQGRLIIIGQAEKAIPVAETLLKTLPAIAIIDPFKAEQDISCDDRIFYLQAEVAQVVGHLGAFEVLLKGSGKQTISLKTLLNRSWSELDMVLDLLPTPLFDAEISPPGYFAPRGDKQQLENFLTSIPEMTGEFEKPRFFNYDPSICAHSRNHKTACTRCIDACPTLAIRSIGERVEVDPYLCQGGGSCAAVCPSGAMQYVFPALDDLLGRLRQLLKTYRHEKGQQARIIFVEAEHSENLYRQLARLEENLIPLVMEELGAVDLAVMLNTLAYGAQQLIVLTSDTTPKRIVQSLQQQQQLADSFLQGLGYTEQRVCLSTPQELENLSLAQDISLPAASYASFNDKRTMIRLALEHLHHHAPIPSIVLPLFAQAPFGEISVDPQACTLCLACSGVCPTQALLSGSDKPQLSFIEDHCVQCGLCEQTCPENAIRRHPRYLFDEERRRSRRELYTEAPFYCISCGKPFATQHMIEHMQAKLANHWMFGNERARQRLEMCEDCRVRDLWDEQGN